MKDIKKVTPKGDLSWYIKWVATFFIVIGFSDVLTCYFWIKQQPNKNNGYDA